MPFVAEASLFIRASVEAAFDKLADLPSWHLWMPRTFRPARPGQEKLREGARIPMHIAHMPLATPIAVYVVDRAREITWGGGIPGVISARHRFLFEPEGEGTRVRSLETWEGPMERVLAPVVKPLAERIGRDQLGALERAVQS